MKTLKRSATLISIVFFVFTAFTINTTAQDADLLSTLEGRDDLSTFVEIVKTAQMESSLQSEGPYTVFALTNDAFGSLDQGTVDQWKSDPTAAQEFLGNHILVDELSSDQLSSQSELQSLNGTGITISSGGGYVMVGGAELVETDIQASNGIIHVLNTSIGSGSGMEFEEETEEEETEEY